MKLIHIRKYITELVSTFILVFAGTGAIVINHVSNGRVTHLGIAMTFGLVVMVMIYAFGDLSGAHMNPAVTIAFTAANKFPLKQVPGYLAAQFAGAVLASIVLQLLFPDENNLGATIPAGSDFQSFELEFLLTFILMLVIFNVAKGSKETGIMAGIAIGGTVGMEALFAGPICGASMNPFRSVAPALVSGNTQSLWIYIIAPVAGALLAVIVFNYLNKNVNHKEQY